MTRIIAGAAGSLTLETPTSGTRPTTDRVREAMFSSLEASRGFDGASVLDLYAGSGALGLEALSRGASSAILVESNSRAAVLCRRNGAKVAAAVGLGATAVVEQRSVQSFLAGAATRGQRFDLVVSDPPYELSESELADDLAGIALVLAQDAAIVVERSTRSPEPAWPPALERTSSKRYGETTLWYARAR